MPAAATGGGPDPVLPALRAVLFDLDDTLYREHQFVDGGFAAVAAFLGARADRPGADLRRRLWELHRAQGRGRIFDALLGELGIGPDPDLLAALVHVYRTHPARLDLLPGAAELLDRLRAAGIRTGLVTDGSAAVQARKIAALDGLGPRLDVVVMTDELGPGHAKPSPTPFRVACLLLELPPADAVYVGNDPRKDFRGARAAGLATVRLGAAPDYGGAAPPPADPADAADIEIDSFPALAAVLAAALGQPARGPLPEVMIP